MKEKNNMTNQNTTINTTTAIQYDNDAEKLSCHDTLPGGGFHGGEQKHTLPGGGFHGGEQKQTLPGGGFLTDDEHDTVPGGCIHGTGQADEQKETLPEGAW